MLKTIALTRHLNNGILTGAVCIMVSLIIGIEATQVSPFLNTAVFNDAYGERSNFIIGLITGTFPLFSCFGSLVPSLIAGKVRRKITIIFSLLFWMVGSMIVFLKTEVAFLLVGKSIKGFCLGVLSSVVPVYIGEVFVEESAAKLMSYFQCCIPTGLFISCLVAYLGSSAPFAFFKKELPDVKIRGSWAMAFTPMAISTGLAVMMRDSPTDFFTQGLSSATMELLLLQTHSLSEKLSEEEYREYVNNRYFQIMKASNNGINEAVASTGVAGVERKKSIGQLFKSCLKSRDVLTAIMTQCAVQLSGINAFMYYFNEICAMSQIDKESIIPLALALNGVNVLVNCLASLYARRVSRVMNILYGFLVMGLCHVLLVLALQSKKSNISNEASRADASGILAIMYCFLAVATFSLTIAIQSILYTVELIPTNLAEIGLPISIACGWFTNFALTCILPTAFNFLSAYVFTFFAIFCFCFYATFFHLKDTFSSESSEPPESQEFQEIKEQDQGEYLNSGENGLTRTSTIKASRFKAPRLTVADISESNLVPSYRPGQSSASTTYVQCNDKLEEPRTAMLEMQGEDGEHKKDIQEIWDDDNIVVETISQRYLRKPSHEINISADSPLAHLSKAVLRKPSGGARSQLHSTAGSFKSTSVGSMINNSFGGRDDDMYE